MIQISEHQISTNLLIIQIGNRSDSHKSYNHESILGWKR